MNMTTVPSDKLKEMQQEIADLKETIAQQAGSIQSLQAALADFLQKQIFFAA